MAEAGRLLLICLLNAQAIGLLALTFGHSRARRYHANFSRWWLHAYGLSVAYASFAATISRGLALHLDEGWTWQTSMIAVATTVGLVAVGGAIWLWLHDDSRRDYGR